MAKRLLAVALIVPLLAACATKRDLRDLQAEVGRMQMSQDELLRELQRQNAAILDTLEAQNIRMRGDFTNELVEIRRQLVQIQELTGQGQQRLAELRQTLNAREEALRRTQAAANAQGVGNPDELFATAEAALDRGSMTAARTGFEDFIAQFPQHPRAPQAHLYLGTILEADDELDEALAHYSSVLEMYPNTDEAATALFRSALIERDRGNEERAQTLLNQLTAAYPGSPEAEQAQEELR